MDYMSERVAVIGCGTMGAGIAQCFADHGLSVTLFGLDADELSGALGRIADNRRLLLDAGLLDGEAATGGEVLLRTTASLDEAADEIDLLIEAVPEDLELKCDLFARLGQMCDPSVTFASNTSGLSITKLGEASGRSRRFAGCHWWNPPQLVPLVEVVSGQQTDHDVIEYLRGLMGFLGKQPIHVRRDVPGFVGNRLQFAVLREALHLVSDGIASPEDVDLAMTGGPGMRYGIIGPLRTADLGGLDVFLSIIRYLWPQLSDAKEPPTGLAERVARGDVGTKSGRGFYDYDLQQIRDIIRERDKFMLGILTLKQQHILLDAVASELP